MKERKNQTTTNNECNLQADTLIDLPVANEQIAAIKGGNVPAYSMVIDRRPS